MVSASQALTADGGTAPEDLLLVRRALQGDSLAVDQVLERLSCVVRFVYRLNRSLGYGLPPEQLEDVVQQVYLAVWPRLPDYVGSAALESWVFGFCRNCLRAAARRRAQAAQTTVGLGADGELGGAVDALRPGPETNVEETEGLDALQAELERLSPAEREVVELRHLEGWSFEQIARQRDLPASTVKDRCYRALVRLRERLERRHVCE